MKKYNNAFLSTFVVAVIFISNSNSITLDKRAESQCGLLGESIYCFGGYLENELNDNKLYRLSLSNWPNGTSLSDLNQSWTLVNHSNSEYRLERRRKAAAAVYSNNTLFITGGYTSGSAVYKNQTIAYNRDTNTWHTLNNYTAVSGSVQQIYSATAVSLTPSESTIVLFGGCTENTRFDGVAPLQTDNLNNTVMHEGFTSMQAFQYDRSRWIERSPQTNTPLRFYAGQTATLDPKTGLIYYLGGYYYTAPDYTISIAQDYHTANVFNSKNGNWQTIELSGDKIPSPRLLPTATMLPNSNHILLFGGSETGQNAACIKFCYSLDLDTREWALRTNDALMTADALRFGHSAVLVGTSLFIMFGFTVYGKPLDNILVISVNDVNNLYFSKTYPYAEREMLPVPLDSSSLSAAPLSTGAIAGIGVVSGLAVVAAILYFLYVRRKKQAERKLEEMPVDWDQVDKFYSHSEQGVLDGEAVNAALSKPSHADASAFAVKYTPNTHDDESTVVKEFRGIDSNSSATFAEEQTKAMKPSMRNAESDVRYVSHSPSPLTMKTKPDVSIEEADRE